MQKRFGRAASIGWRILLILIFALILKPKCQNIWFYKDQVCHEYCAEGDWSSVEFCKKHAEPANLMVNAGWMCKKSSEYDGVTKCSWRCFENNYVITLTSTACQKVVY